MAYQKYSFCIYLSGLIMAFTILTESVAEHTVKLSSGYDMPVVGLGTWQINPDDIDKAVTTALENGYKHIDTAFVYYNEDAIGKSLKKWFDKGGKREDLFITTKLPYFGNRAADVEAYIKLSLEMLGLQYVDMYLIHLPMGFAREESSYKLKLDKDGKMVLDVTTDHLAIWKAMEKVKKEGLARSIGISNFNESQILNILNHAEIKPSNLQIELQAYNQQKSLRDFCAKHGIVVTAYSTLGSPGTQSQYKKSLPNLLHHSTVKEIADHHNKTTAQVLLRHANQNGLIVIPKSINPERIKSNIDIFDFELTPEEMKKMNDLDQGEEGRLINFLGFHKGLEKHPEYPFSYHIKNVQ